MSERDKREAQRQKKLYERIVLWIRKDSMVLLGLWKMQDRTGETYGSYAKKALCEKLQREGYITIIPENE